MLTMNGLEPIRYYRSAYGMVVEFCIMSDAIDSESAKEQCKNFLEAYGYSQSKVGKHVYNITDNIRIIMQYQTDSEGKCVRFPIAVMVYYRQNDSEYDAEIVENDAKRMLDFYARVMYNNLTRESLGKEYI